MPPVRTQSEHDRKEQRDKLANSYQALLSEFGSTDLRSVGNYTLGRLIGKGSFGKVYLGQHKLTNGSKVVLKSTRKDDPNLSREVHHHRQFLHPHIARLYEVIVTETQVWLVLEWCPGDELYNHLLNNGRMAPEKVQKIFTQLVGAVSYVHQRSCVHRDLKLENILLDKSENVKLVDFGFTREYQGTTSYLQTWCGTVCYSAPEMLKGEKYAGEKVDVWSLGIILYALLCGELPYDEDDDTATKAKILKEEPTYPEYLPDGAKELIKKLLSKRPILRPSLGDVLKTPWLSDHAPQQQEILKLQQPAPFSTQIEKDTLQRMLSAGVNIDTVIEHVLAQRCDSLAGWWSLLIEKEQRKERRREKKRKEREAEIRSLRRLSAASSRLLALGEIDEGQAVSSPATRGRTSMRLNGLAEPPSLSKVVEVRSTTSIAADQDPPPAAQADADGTSRSPSRPPPPPKDYSTTSVRRPPNVSRGSSSTLRVVTNNPDLLGPQYVPPPQRKRRLLIHQPLREHLAWVKHWFKEGTHKRNNTPVERPPTKNAAPPRIIMNGGMGTERLDARGKANNVGQKSATEPSKRISFDGNSSTPTRVAIASRPRINTTSTVDSGSTTHKKRQSLSPGTLTPRSSLRKPSAGLRGRKSTSSSVSSIRSTFQAPHHQHTHSKTSSTSSASIASPSGLSSASGSRLGRSPHSSVKILPSTPVGTLPSGLRVSKRPLPAAIGTLPTFGEQRPASLYIPPASPSLPVFARRKRSVFRGPSAGGSPAGHGRVGLGGVAGGRSGNATRRTSTEIPDITEENEDEEEQDEDEEGGEIEDDDDADVYEDEGEEGADEEVDQFGPAFAAAVLPGDADAFTDIATPLSPVDNGPLARTLSSPSSGSGAESSRGRNATPLTARALARMQEEEDRKAAAAAARGHSVVVDASPDPI